MTKTELLTIAKPILFNTDMVMAILDNRKTVTRRAIKPQPDICCDGGFTYDKIANNLYCKGCGNPFMNSIDKECMPKYQVGDYLYVRETWAEVDNNIAYRANDEVTEGWNLTAWKPSIHMPKEAARIFLRVTDVRVERLQDITEEQCEKEGMTEKQKSVLAKEEYWYWFKELWDSLLPKNDNKFKAPEYGWNTNPWVWAIGFERIEVDE